MEIKIHTHHVEKSDMFEERIRKSLNEINEKYIQQVDTASVNLEKEGHEFVVGVRMRQGGKLLVQGRGVNTDPYAAMQACLERVAKQLRRYKRQLRDMKPKGVRTDGFRADYRIIGPFIATENPDEGESFTSPLGAEYTPDDGGVISASKIEAETDPNSSVGASAIEANLPPDIIVESHVDIDTLSVQQAVMRMDLLSVNAIMFQNADTDEINMVYYRPDGRIGWVSGPVVTVSA